MAKRAPKRRRAAKRAALTLLAGLVLTTAAAAFISTHTLPADTSQGQQPQDPMSNRQRRDQEPTTPEDEPDR